MSTRTKNSEKSFLNYGFELLEVVIKPAVESAIEPISMGISAVPSKERSSKKISTSHSNEPYEMKDDSISLNVQLNKEGGNVTISFHPSAWQANIPIKWSYHPENRNAPTECWVTTQPEFVVQSEAALPIFSAPQAVPAHQSLYSSCFSGNEEAVKNLHNSLVFVYKLVDPKTRWSRFYKLFGKSKMGKPINWIGKVNSLTYFLKKLKDAEIVSVENDAFWRVAEECFVVHGKKKYNLRTYALKSNKVKQQIDKLVKNIVAYDSNSK